MYDCQVYGSKYIGQNWHSPLRATLFFKWNAIDIIYVLALPKRFVVVL